MSDSRECRDPVAIPPGDHFSEVEWKAMQADDRKAGGAVVLLITSIFLVGVVLYSIVAWTVAF